MKIETVAIIGAGPSGLAAAKYFRAEKAFKKIIIFEQRSSIGGIWNYTPDARDENLFTVPQTEAKEKVQEPVWKEVSRKESGVDDVVKEPVFVSPIYEQLETNIPRGLMGFSDLNWPADAQLLPRHETVLEYLQTYGEEVMDLVQLDTQVINVQPVDDSPTGAWRVQTRNLKSGEEKEEEFGAVVVANGHFIVPYVPDIEGIKEWNEKFPGAISHSKYFRTADEFEGKKVIVVGNSASGLDICTQVMPICKTPLLWSNKTVSALSPAPSPLRHEKPPIAKFTPSTRGVTFADGSTSDNIDAIIFATGYFYNLPFLNTLTPPLITDGAHVSHTYKHLLYAPRPTLSFLTLLQRVVPFPIAETQSAVLARLYSGRLSLPSRETLLSWDSQHLSQTSDPRAFHLLPFPKDGEYINELSDWAAQAPPKNGLQDNGNGKRPPRWGEWEFWARENFPAIRRKFVGLSVEERRRVRTLEELGGFEFTGGKETCGEELI